MGNTSIQTQSYRAVDKDAGQSRSYIIPFALLCSLFFLWAVANNLNDILLPQFQQAFTLTQVVDVPGQVQPMVVSPDKRYLYV
ncbi:hypothetical protein ACUODJ_36295, partial [Escherichia sp. HC-CC]